MSSRISVHFTLVLGLALLLCACQSPPSVTPPSANIEPTPTIPEPTATAPMPAPSPTLAPPVSDAPAAGICARAEGEWATADINSDVPSPRCLQVTAVQKLRVVNRTTSLIHITLAGYVVSVPAGAEGAIGVPFGAYLAPGVHSVGASPYSGPQIWLVTR